MALLPIVEAAWKPLHDYGIRPPFTIHVLEELDCSCSGWYSSLGSITVNETLCALPHEFAHHASQMLYGHPQADHLWTLEVRMLLNIAADQIGCGHE